MRKTLARESKSALSALDAPQQWCYICLPDPNPGPRESPSSSKGGSCIHGCLYRLVGDRYMCNAGCDCLYADRNGPLPRNCGWGIESKGCFGEKYGLSEAARCLIGLNVSNHGANCRLLLARVLKISAEVVP